MQQKHCNYCVTETEWLSAPSGGLVKYFWKSQEFLVCVTARDKNVNSGLSNVTINNNLHLF